MLNFCSVSKRLLLIAILTGAVLPAGAQTSTPPDVPEQLKVPPGQLLGLQVHAKGDQIYVCQVGADGKAAWNLKAPDAELRDLNGAVIGQHFAGPTWKDNDGSEVTGKVTAKANSPDPDSIPWLLLAAVGHSGQGVLSRVTYVQRINTKAGMPPPAADCTAATQNKEARSAYTADYYFYAPAP